MKNPLASPNATDMMRSTFPPLTGLPGPVSVPEDTPNSRGVPDGSGITQASAGGGLAVEEEAGHEHHCRLEQKRTKEADAWLENHWTTTGSIRGVWRAALT